MIVIREVVADSEKEEDKLFHPLLTRTICTSKFGNVVKQHFDFQS